MFITIVGLFLFVVGGSLLIRFLFWIFGGREEQSRTYRLQESDSSDSDMVYSTELIDRSKQEPSYDPREHSRYMHRLQEEKRKEETEYVKSAFEQRSKDVDRWISDVTRK